MLKKLFGYFKREIQLTKEYYQGKASPEPVEDSDRKGTQPTKESYQVPVMPKPAPVSDDSDNGLTYMAPKPISNEEYWGRRQDEENIVVTQYDFATVEGIRAIPGTVSGLRIAGRDPDAVDR